MHFPHCPLCNNSLFKAKLKECKFCPEYTVLMEVSAIIFERIKIGNMDVIYYGPSHSSPNLRNKIVFRSWGDIHSNTVLSESFIKELTPQLAVEWLERLKTLALFQ